MKTHNFTIVGSGVDTRTADFADRFYAAGCDDATLSMQKGLVVLEFDRKARSFSAALFSALRDVKRAGANIERVEPDYLVNASEIAKRTGMGRAAISLYAKGERAQAFPHPVARVTTDSPLWDWVEVSSWMYHEHKLPLGAVVEAKMVREVNRVVTGDRLPPLWLARQLQMQRIAEAAQ